MIGGAKMKKLLLIAAMSLALGACATTPDPMEADNAIAAAEKEISAAKKSGFLWNNTEKFLDAAKKDKKEGDIKGAIKNAKKAMDEAKMAQVQAKDQANPKVHFPN